MAPPPLGIDLADWERLRHSEHSEPHRVLGAHPAHHNGQDGVVIRAFHRESGGVAAHLPDGRIQQLDLVARGGLYATFVPGATTPLAYRLRYHFPDGNDWETDDPYRFLPTMGDLDLHLFNEGTHRRLWEVMGAHPREMDGVQGCSFAVWAPTARRVSVIGDFCDWDGRRYPMRQMGSSGVWELFIPGVQAGAVYKYEIKTASGDLRIKSDPYAFIMENPPATASRIFASQYHWQDQAWIDQRSKRDLYREPMLVYEAHLGSWARVHSEHNRSLSYREIAPRLIEHCKRFGYNYIEFMPLSEYPFDGSWGYQVTGYFAPTSRYGSPDDFRWMVDQFHQAGIGVIIDWVPAHFPKDDFALRRFDGTALYEHDDPRRGEHPDWGTLIFNFDRHEVMNFLLASALYWCRECHVDALRVDAVASMLYLDYSRKEGEWIPNRYGGRENLGAIELLRRVNTALEEDCPGSFTIAEESTAWGGVSKPVRDGGLGFKFKWNMGWMHDTLEYFSKDPIHRRYHHDELTFAMLYEYSEHFINALSHDEVVHGKRSLLEKMPGDLWQKFSNLRLLMAYQYLRPGKVLNFMGFELAAYSEWYYGASLDWHLLDDPRRALHANFLEALGRLYHETPCFWRRDHEPDGFRWIDCNDRDNSIYSFVRSDGDEQRVVVMNMTPVPRDNYRIGAPRAGNYRCVFTTDAKAWGGSDYRPFETVHTEGLGCHGFDQSLILNLPPLALLVLAPQ